jgi:hypothetical protein
MIETTNSRSHESMHFVEIKKIGTNENKVLSQYLKNDHLLGDSVRFGKENNVLLC